MMLQSVFLKDVRVVSGRIVGDVDDDLIHNAHAAPVLTLRVKLASAFVPMERRKQMDSAAVVELRRYLNLKRTTALRVGRTAGSALFNRDICPALSLAYRSRVSPSRRPPPLPR